MPDTRADLDRNITALTDILTTLISAFETWRGQQTDFSSEDNQLITAFQAAQTELNNINPPPPAPTP